VARNAADCFPSCSATSVARRAAATADAVTADVAATVAASQLVDANRRAAVAVQSRFADASPLVVAMPLMATELPLLLRRWKPHRCPRHRLWIPAPA
jgi:hypothetical protein